ncbi:hypothetical protein [Pelagovum pacificum]|uniref:Uncharacterized protein n=1 Tax=Pelagovum pacificum TaxID=2588711 RepID=A0A5C5GDR5_9RHOB|nr:hypothetical protein [Pelagovum pacificum]QQA43946.1 hypothetical protein I8N54_05040 [Pelagovum pacificum]TNY32925.1 hypothetical protein FHY64_06510 [Pelagovum pacificum]
MNVSASALAAKLGVTRGRISQLVSEGKLDGCYQGEGRGRRFDLGKSAEALGKRLDPGQMMGNGADTRRALHDLASGADGEDEAPRRQRPDGVLDGRDPDRYELARTQKAEEEARKLRRQNAEAEGTFVLASSVEREVAKQLGQEIAEFEMVLRDGARRIADELGVDFGRARQLLVQTWRAHRGARSEAAAETGEGVELSDAERAEDI